MCIETAPSHVLPKLRRSGMTKIGHRRTRPAPAVRQHTCRSYGAWAGFRLQRTINMALLTELFHRGYLERLSRLTSRFVTGLSRPESENSLGKTGFVTTSRPFYPPGRLSLLVGAVLLIAAALPAAEPETGFKSIFNGKDLTGWDGNPKLWSVKDGAILGQTTAENPIKGNTFLIWTNGEVGDFELRCSFKITANNDKGFANSGIQYRSQILDPANWVVGGYQADMEAGQTYTGILYEERMTRGIMAGRGEKVVWGKDCQKQVTGSLGASAELQAAIKQGDWNDYVVIAKGNHLQHFINGKQTIDVTDECEAKRAMKGILALQLHAGQPMSVQFKNLRLKTSSGDKASAADELKKMEGDWQIAGIEMAGTTVSSNELPKVVVTIKGDTFKVANVGMEAGGRFSINLTETPPQIDIHADSGPDQGRTFPGIYELGAETMRICCSRLGRRRPTSFSSGENGNFVLINYIRSKK